MATRLEEFRGSNEFLNLLPANINSAVLIVDEHLNIHQFNDFFVESFAQDAISLHRGDKLVFYTDGMVECRNHANELFGKKRFFDVLRKHREKPVEDIADEVHATLKRYLKGSPPEDDISTMVMECTPQKPA
jgi:sigma-B regulation protein RsbU (phosphoserine phosphatase)